MFPKKHNILEEYVGSMSRIQKEKVSHKSTDGIARSVDSCKSLPLRVDQVLDIRLSSRFSVIY